MIPRLPPAVVKGTVKQYLDTLFVRLRANLPHALQTFEQALDALLAALTGEPLITDDFKSDDLNLNPA